MAKILKKPFNDDQYLSNNKRRTSSSSSPFLCCFGYSRKVLSEKNSPQENINQSTLDHNDIMKKKKKLSWSSRFRKKNPTGIKTVPVDYSDKDTKLHWSKPKSKSTDRPAKSRTPPSTEIEIVVPAAPDPTPKEKPQEVCGGAPPRNSNLKSRKAPVSVPLHFPKDDTCQRRISFGRKIEAIRNGSSQPGSPSNGKSKLSRTATVMTRQHSDILPLPTRERPRVAPTKRTGARETEPAAAQRFEPLVGMSILMVTLVIMILWGRVCAILCTSAWFYFVPRLSTAVGSVGGMGNGSGSKSLDLDSQESKKKVVFEGFLERNYHRFSS
ncbi:uncharacterized protein At5g23160 [Humulus lupulus]|uniref:uncharacterized protein At5g23160 n=1 Tax=Humulus lupulus TaxID=3486 RepID=UPI002B40117A|nr:uncharacterized protein At5g23160 [Humulus lupulus]